LLFVCCDFTVMCTASRSAQLLFVCCDFTVIRANFARYFRLLQLQQTDRQTDRPAEQFDSCHSSRSASVVLFDKRSSSSVHRAKRGGERVAGVSHSRDPRVQVQEREGSNCDTEISTGCERIR